MRHSCQLSKIILVSVALLSLFGYGHAFGQQPAAAKDIDTHELNVQQDNTDTQLSRASSAQANVHILPREFNMPGLDRTRTVRLYLPPDYADDTIHYSVLYMHDGQNLFDQATSYIGEWQVDETLNQLAAEHDLRLIVVGIDNGGDKRMQELSPYDHHQYGESEGQAYLDFIIDVVKPYIDSHYRTKAGKAHTGIMGSSMGGLMTHYAIYTRPDVFSKAGIYSASFWYSEQAFALTQSHPLPKTTKLDFLVGTDEGEDMVNDTNKMLKLIDSQGHPSQHLRAEVVEGAKHNEAFWASRFAQSVLWLYQ